LWATPAIKALRETFPSSLIAVLTSPTGQAVLKHNRRIDALFCLKNPLFFSFLSLYFQLKALKISHVIVFHASQRLVLPFVALFGAQCIGSYGINKGLDDLLTHVVDHGPVHEIERRLELVATIGARTLDPSMELFVGNEDEQVAAELIKRLDPSGYLPFIVIHPGAKDRFKQWPPEHFIDLGQRLVDSGGCRILITGSKEEEELVKTIASQIPGAEPVLSLSVTQLAALFKRVRLFIGNDTGPMHVALSQHIPTIGLFSPTQPARCGPYQRSNGLAIAKPPACTPCIKKRCQDPFCLLQIGVDEVYLAALRFLYAEAT
jgi:ADP-heptose:LPS heptosyltransferase